MKNTQKSFLYLAVCLLLQPACQPSQKPTEQTTNSYAAMPPTKEVYGFLPDGRTADLYTFINKNGLEMKVTNYGGIVVSLKTPDRNGKMEDIVLGYEKLEDYLKNNPYFGCLVGRYGNRIAKGKFTLDGKTYDLAVNNDPNHLHGGLKGYDKVLWDASVADLEGATGLRLTYKSKDLEEGYPGNLDVSVLYALTDANELRIEYTATTDKKTPVNLTHHGYFNLSGDCKMDILSHQLQIDASAFTPVDKTLIPNGEQRKLDGSPLDFRQMKPIGQDINKEEDEQIKFGLGYDHNYVLTGGKTEHLHSAAKVYEPVSGRLMEVETTEPGVQFYSGNFLDGTLTGKGGVVYKKRWGLCLETQHFPDSPNQPSFPTTILEPGQTYNSLTVYRFSIK